MRIRALSALAIVSVLSVAGGCAGLSDSPAAGSAAILPASNAAPARGSALPTVTGSLPESGGGGFSLAALGLAAVAGDSARARDAPVAVYARLARGINACWLKPGQMRLPGHGFFAEVPAGTSTGRITIFAKVEGRKLGNQAFKIAITSDGDGALVSSENVRLDAGDAQALKTDIARWAGGAEDCGRVAQVQPLPPR